MKAITSITWGALILMLLFALATPAPATANVAGYRVLDGHDEDDSDMYDHDDMDDEEEDEEETAEEEDEEEEAEEEDEEEESEEEEDEEEESAEEEEEEDDSTLEAPEYEWFSAYPLLHPTMENEIYVQLSGSNEEYTWAWSVEPAHFTLSGTTTNTVSFTGVTSGEWAAGTEYTFSVTLTGASQQVYETQMKTYIANDLPEITADAYTISPLTGEALDTDFTHTWTAASDSYPADGTLSYELVRVDGEMETLMTRNSGLTRYHLQGDADNDDVVTFRLTVTDEGMASTSVTKTITVTEKTFASEDAKTTFIGEKVDEIDLSSGTDDEKVQNLGLLNSLSQALEFSGDDSDGEEVEETEAEIAAKATLTNTIIDSVADALTDAATDDVVDAVLGAAETVSANTAYLDDTGRDNLLNLFESAAGRDDGLTPDMATAAVGGLSNVLDSLDTGDDEEGSSTDNTETYAKVDAIVDSAFDAVFSSASEAREVVIETPNIKATFAKTSKDEVEQVVAAGDNSVDVPSAAAGNVPEGSSVLLKVVAKTYNPYAATAVVKSGILEFSVKAQNDAGDISDVAVSGLTGDDRVCLEIAVDSVDDDTACKYWDVDAEEFSEEGLERTDSTATSITCCSSHATEYAAGEADADDDDESDADDDEETEDDNTSAAIATLSATALVALLF